MYKVNKMGVISYTSLTVAIVKINEGDFPDSGVTAHIQFAQNKDDVIRITGYVRGLPKTNSSKYGFHVHEKYISDNDCDKCGSHFNPLASDHGGPGARLGMIHFYILETTSNNTQKYKQYKLIMIYY